MHQQRITYEKKEDTSAKVIIQKESLGFRVFRCEKKKKKEIYIKNRYIYMYVEHFGRTPRNKNNNSCRIKRSKKKKKSEKGGKEHM